MTASLEIFSAAHFAVFRAFFSFRSLFVQPLEPFLVTKQNKTKEIIYIKHNSRKVIITA